MKPTRAKEILEDLLTDSPQYDPELRREAIIMAISAFTGIELCRAGFGIIEIMHLQGET